MPHVVQCSCGQQLTVEQWYDGMRVRCPSCQAVLAPDPQRERAADTLARAAHDSATDDAADSDGPPTWLLAACLAIALVLLAVYLFATPGRFLTGLALLLTGVPLTLTGLYLNFQPLFDQAGNYDLDEPSLARRASKLLFLAGLLMAVGGFVAMFGK
jgi:hypothetical protein